MTILGDLPAIFGLVAVFGIALYVVLDGLDLGVGILFLAATARDDGDERGILMNSIAPFWDGNETWLVLGGVMLLAAFPLAYATLLPALYVPVMVMLFALIFRGIAFEFRFKALRSRRLWDWAFSLGSILAAGMQGLMLGGFMHGFNVVNGVFAGGPLDFLTWFGVASAFGVIAGYALLGSAWLVYKTAGITQIRARRRGRRALIAVAFFIALISILTPLDHPDIAGRWFSTPNLYYLSPVPLLTGLLIVWLWRAFAAPEPDLRPLQLTIPLFLLSLGGLGVSLWPYIVPRQITLWQAAAEPKTLEFTGVGVLITLPVILAYMAYSYWVFRGKVTADSGYH